MAIRKKNLPESRNAAIFAVGKYNDAYMANIHMWAPPKRSEAHTADEHV